MELNERKKAILRSVVDAYIATGEPVGSKYLTTKEEFNVSSATIRNEMNDLESMGYLEQPHTSAGRVPTAKGYRTYVENLMGRYYLAMEEVEVLDEVIENKLHEMNALMEEASHAIGELTNYTSFAFIGGSGTEADRYETLLIGEHDFLLVMICKDGSVRSRQVKTQESINNDVIETAKRALNKCFVGITHEQVNLNTVMLHDILSQTYLIAILNIHELLLCFFIVRINCKFLDMRKICNPIVSDMICHPVSKQWISMH